MYVRLNGIMLGHKGSVSHNANDKGPIFAGHRFLVS